jgi:hypothetical protein
MKYEMVVGVGDYNRGDIPEVSPDAQNGITDFELWLCVSHLNAIQLAKLVRQRAEGSFAVILDFCDDAHAD